MDAAAGREAHDIARVVSRGPLAIGAGQVLAGDQDPDRVIFAINLAGHLPIAMDHVVDLAPRLIVR